MIRRHVWIAVVVALGCGCKSTKKEAAEEPPKEPAAAPATPAPPPPVADAAPAAADDTIGADKMGTFTCAELEHDVCKGATDHFAATAPVVHLTYRTRELPQVGDVYVVQWIAEDVGDAAPPNTVIATVEDKVEVVAPGTLNYVVNSQLTRPTSGWPVGTYRVEIKLGDRVATTAHFAIE